MFYQFQDHQNKFISLKLKSNDMYEKLHIGLFSNPKSKNFCFFQLFQHKYIIQK